MFLLIFIFPQFTLIFRAYWHKLGTFLVSRYIHLFAKLRDIDCCQANHRHPTKRYAPKGILWGNSNSDEMIAGDKVIKGNPDYASKLDEAGMVNLEGIVDSYVHLFRQKPQAWTFELDLRTSIENW